MVSDWPLFGRRSPAFLPDFVVGRGGGRGRVEGSGGRQRQPCVFFFSAGCVVSCYRVSTCMPRRCSGWEQKLSQYLNLLYHAPDDSSELLGIWQKYACLCISGLFSCEVCVQVWRRVIKLGRQPCVCRQQSDVLSCCPGYPLLPPTACGCAPVLHEAFHARRDASFFQCIDWI